MYNNNFAYALRRRLWTTLDIQCEIMITPCDVQRSMVSRHCETAAIEAYKANIYAQLRVLNRYVELSDKLRVG
jgi:hypothetical protein